MNTVEVEIKDNKFYITKGMWGFTPLTRREAERVVDLLSFAMLDQDMRKKWKKENLI